MGQADAFGSQCNAIAATRLAKRWICTICRSIDEKVILVAFDGEFLHGIDEKGRLIIPAKYRDSLGHRYMLCKGLEDSLFAYPMDAWAKLIDKLDDLNVFTRKNRDFKRRFFSGSTECEIDKQGRTLISQPFRKHASLTKDVYFIGAGDHIELWDKDAWETYSRDLDADYEALAEEVFA